MPQFLRIISNLDRWETEEGLSEVSIDDVTADAVTDLKTTNNCLSVFRVEDNQSNLNDIITAFAATRLHLNKPVYYLLFNPNIAEQLKIPNHETKGDTPDQLVNVYHRNLEIRTGMTLIRLAKELLTNSKFGSQEVNVLARSLKAAMDTGRLKLSEELTTDVIKQLRKEIN
jgi:hypothetical protein